MRENKLVKKHRIHRFLYSPWKTDQARAATLALLTGVIVIIILSIVWFIPDNDDTVFWIELACIVNTLLAFIILFFNAKVCKIIFKNKNIDIARGFKIAGLSFIKWCKTAPLNIITTFDVIGTGDKEKLLANPDARNRNYKQYYREFARWHISSKNQSEKIDELISEAGDLVFPIVTRLATSTRLRKFASMDEFLMAAASVLGTWGVVVVEKAPATENSVRETILDILQLLEVYPKGVWRVVAFGTNVISAEEIAQFMLEAKCVLIYDEHEFLSGIDSVPEPLVPVTKLAKIGHDLPYMRSRPQYRWEGELPDAFVKTAVSYEFLQARVAANAMFKLQERKTFTRIEVIRLLKVLSLDRTSITEADFPDTILASDHKSNSIALVTRELQYDKSKNEIVWKVSKISEEFSDLHAIWQTIMMQSGFETIFVADDEDDEGKPIKETSGLFEDPVQKIADLIGMESYIDAYYAGVPVSDIIV